MFKNNPADKQLSLTDPYLSYSQYVQEALLKSWAETFLKTIFVNIEEERFALLYSEKTSRPNAAVNVLIGLLILKELNNWSDIETIASLYFDYRVQYALGITDFEKERICVNTLGNFRSRLYQFNEEEGRDLLAEEIASLNQKIIDFTEMDTSFLRQDSMMISSNAKKMGRLELIYTVNANMVKLFRAHDSSLLPPSFKHYGQEKDKADHVYRVNKEEVKQKTLELLKESVELYNSTPEELKHTEEFKALERLIGEQINQDQTPKKNKEIPADSLQNPSEPDATYRCKGNKSYNGYVMNLVEAYDRAKNLSLIVYHELQPNVVSDVELGLNALEELTEGQTLVSDGAYFSQKMVEKAAEKEVNLSFSALSGRSVAEEALGADQFLIDPETELILACPGGNVPLKAERDHEKETYKARFAKETCASCPLKERCIIKEQVKSNLVTFTDKQLTIAIYRTLLGTAEHQALGDFRAGVEGVPSVLRRRYRIDELSVRGLIRSNIWDNLKIMAYNFSSVHRYLQRNRVAALSWLHFLRYLSRLFPEKAVVGVTVGR